jgi:hypothetical protein
LRAHGRAGEWRQPFERAGQTIEQDFVLPGDKRSDIESHQTYLAIDAEGIKSLSTGCSITVNGIDIDGPIVPGFTVVQQFPTMRHLSSDAVYWEGEYIFDCMTSLVQRSDADLRQWFMVPLSESILRSGQSDNKLHVVLRRTGDMPGAAVFGMYKSDKGKIDVPSFKRYSWEKSFYGVENDHGLTDPRVDGRAVVKPLWRAEDLSDEAGLQSGAYSMRILVDKHVAPGAVVKIAESLPTKPDRRTADGWDIDFKALPSYAPGDLWYVQFKVAPSSDACVYSKVRCLACSVDAGRVVSYHSPWVPRTVPAVDGEFTVPIEPSALPGKLNFLRLCFLEASTAFGDNQVKTAPPSVQATIWRVSRDRTLKSFTVY